jgi:deoxyribodipyrimidine photolyase-related protein
MEAVLIYPHQLFEEHPALAKDRAVYLVEDPLYFSQYKFHTQKLILHRASMKAYADSLKTNGYTVCYVEHTEAENLDTLLTKEKLTRLHIADVVDNWLTKKIVQMAQKIAAQVVWYDTPQFLLTDQEVKSYWKNGKHLQQAFYIWQRKRLGILIEDNKPVGGKWSFDADNRKRLPKGIVVPYMPKVRHSTYVQEAKEYVGKEFTDHYGNSETFAYATTHAQARACLDSFLQERFTHFGAYEDAMSTHSHTLFHSILSPYLNIGLLTPHEVLTAVLSYAKAHKVPINISDIRSVSAPYS